jgi:hypothetical protein
MIERPDEFKITRKLGSWEVSLVCGGMVHLAAHAYSQEEGNYVFVALAVGVPDYEIELARIPVDLVTKVIGG